MSRLTRRVLVLVALLAGAPPASAHSDASSFSAQDEGGGDHHDHAPAVDLYLAVVTFDARKVHDVVLKVNARIVQLHVNTLGAKVSRGDVLAEFESAELTTLQRTFIESVSNRDAMAAFSHTADDKLLEGRMNLAWRGLSQQEIDFIERTRRPVEQVKLAAPVDGVVVGIDTAVGRIVTAGSRGNLFSSSGVTLFQVAARDALLVEAFLPTAIAGALSEGAEVNIVKPGSPATMLPATVVEVASLANPRNRTQTVRLRLRDPAGGELLKQGQVVGVAIPGSQKEGGDHHD